MFFTFPENAHWNAERQAVEFGVEIGEHRVVRVPRRVFQRLLPERPTPERCVEAYYLHAPLGGGPLRKQTLEHAPRDPDDAAVLPDLDAELYGLLLGVPVGVLGEPEEQRRL